MVMRWDCGRYTYYSRCWLKKKVPQNDFSFCIGSDWLQPGTDIRTWESRDPMDPSKTVVTGEKLVSEFDFLVMKRLGYEVEDISHFGPNFSWLKHTNGFSMLESNASSTEIRRRAKADWEEVPHSSSALSRAAHRLRRLRRGWAALSLRWRRLDHIDSPYPPASVTVCTRRGSGTTGSCSP